MVVKVTRISQAIRHVNFLTSQKPISSFWQHTSVAIELELVLEQKNRIVRHAETQKDEKFDSGMKESSAVCFTARVYRQSPLAFKVNIQVFKKKIKNQY